jgi:hypothetical protein
VTPISEPIRACELEFGIPNHQVPMFQNRGLAKTATSMPVARLPSGGVKIGGGMISTSA